MRTLTLGVLIVSGGTLAALPFRRQQVIPDASVQKTHATGPTFSDLEGSMLAAEQPPTVTDAQVDVEVQNQFVSTLLPSLPEHAPRPAAPRQRRIDIPLTYEDLEEPIDQPPAIEERFNATVEVHARSLDAERVAGLAMPAMESLAVSQQEELQRVAESVRQDDVEVAAAQLASSALPSGDFEPLPTPSNTDATRERLWIRQP